ncbi:dodecin family protein [Neiella sp. HB171785]|uniref:Dodecin family protein n=1 Tax=Neiella litorisoli TaxID=2771431 RepID=A0A8J6QU17_9GAMM|nr:dodecin [Neiella litorisoli]MBD1389362.1 dodecin family protein [Neiella litorisoli]
MSEHTYKLTELVGSSPDGVDAAVNNAVARASQSIRNMRWFEVKEIRGHIDKGAVAHWQVTIKVGFTLED